MRRLLGASASVLLVASATIGITTTQAAAAETHVGCVTFDNSGNITGEIASCTQTQIFKDQVTSMSQPNPCNSTVDGVLTEDLTNQVLHTTVNKAGDIWVTSTQTGTVSFVPTDHTQPTYVGHLTDWFGLSLNKSNAVIHGTANATLTGTDGTTITLHLVQHTSFSATGVVNSFTIGGYTCP